MKRKKIKLFIVSAVLCSTMMFSMTGCGATQDTTDVQDQTTADSAQTETQQQQEVESSSAGSHESESVQEQAEENHDEIASDLVYDTQPAVTISGEVVLLGADMAELEEKLGEPDNYQTAKSCTGEGDDKVYAYAGTNIYTYPISGQDIIYMIEVQQEGKLVSNIGIGNTRQDVLAVYGEDNTDDGAFITYEYEEGNVTISFQMKEDAITFIEMYEAR